MAQKIKALELKVPKWLQPDNQSIRFWNNLIESLRQTIERTGGSDEDLIDELFGINTFETTPTLAIAAKNAADICDLESFIANHTQIMAKLSSMESKIDHLEAQLSVKNGEIASIKKQAEEAEDTAWLLQ